MKRIENTDYFITKEGVVISSKNGGCRYLKLSNTSNGYKCVKLYINKKYKIYLIHRLVYKYFSKNFDKNLQINHKDLDKNNNHISNLEQCTCVENINHYLKSIGKDIYKIKITNKENGVDILVNTLEEARKIVGVKTRGSIMDYINNRTKNKNGFICEKVF